MNPPSISVNTPSPVVNVTSSTVTKSTELKEPHIKEKTKVKVKIQGKKVKPEPADLSHALDAPTTGISTGIQVAIAFTVLLLVAIGAAIGMWQSGYLAGGPAYVNTTASPANTTSKIPIFPTRPGTNPGGVCEPACGINQSCTSSRCVCDPGWGGVDCLTKVCTPPCQNGTCDGGSYPFSCSCYAGYDGAQCQNFNCNAIGNCNGNGNCTGANTCSCNAGFQAPDCKYKPNGAPVGFMIVAGVEVGGNWGGTSGADMKCKGLAATYAENPGLTRYERVRGNVPYTVSMTNTQQRPLYATFSDAWVAPSWRNNPIFKKPATVRPINNDYENMLMANAGQWEYEIANNNSTPFQYTWSNIDPNFGWGGVAFGYSSVYNSPNCNDFTNGTVFGNTEVANPTTNSLQGFVTQCNAQLILTCAIALESMGPP